MGRYTIHRPQSHESLSITLSKARSNALPQTRLSLAISLTPNLSLSRALSTLITLNESLSHSQTQSIILYQMLQRDSIENSPSVAVMTSLQMPPFACFQVFMILTLGSFFVFRVFL